MTLVRPEELPRAAKLRECKLIAIRHWRYFSKLEVDA